MEGNDHGIVGERTKCPRVTGLLCFDHEVFRTSQHEDRVWASYKPLNSSFTITSFSEKLGQVASKMIPMIIIS